jgi:hypothetical protein
MKPVTVCQRGICASTPTHGLTEGTAFRNAPGCENRKPECAPAQDHDRSSSNVPSNARASCTVRTRPQRQHTGPGDKLCSVQHFDRSECCCRQHECTSDPSTSWTTPSGSSTETHVCVTHTLATIDTCSSASVRQTVCSGASRPRGLRASSPVISKALTSGAAATPA